MELGLVQDRRGLRKPERGSTDSHSMYRIVVRMAVEEKTARATTALAVPTQMQSSRCFCLNVRIQNMMVSSIGTI